MYKTAVYTLVHGVITQQKLYNCVHSCSHFNCSYCVLFYCIVWLRLSSINKRIWWRWWANIKKCYITQHNIA